ncbi:MAG TPA: YkgJ family cysteine cluster protein [Vicinamibacterales bacterium]|nr:YkgJ family cysteine cluster protein [Vicinamibacterales bacterium]
MKFFWLNFHTDYACRDSGMCCSSGWPIPVERSRVPAIEEAIRSDVIPLQVVPWLVPDAASPDDVAGTLALRPNGHCVFFEAGKPGCAIHSIKPAGCVHFPYVCLIDQRGVHVTLSHFCPTAVSLLFDHREPIAIVEGPAPVAGDLEGLDARESLPPTFAKATVGKPAVAKATVGKPAVARATVGEPAVDGPATRLMTLDELSQWERDAVAAARVDELSTHDIALFEQARSAVPAPWSWPDAPAHLEDSWYSLVAPGWHKFEDALTRFAAAKIFGSWSLYLGNGTEAAAHTARIASAVLRIEAARQCRIFGQPLNRESLTEAIRQTDLLVVHYADPSLLAGVR